MTVWAKVLLAVWILLMGLAAAEPVAEVYRLVRYRVQEGRLRVEYDPADTNGLSRLISFYGQRKIAELYSRRVLEEVNQSLEGFNPLTEWRVVDADATNRLVLARIPEAERAAATQGEQSLGVWLRRFAGRDRGTFFDWTPTRPPQVGDLDSDEPAAAAEGGAGSAGEAGNAAFEDPLRSVLARATSSLIGRIRSGGVGTIGQTNEPVLKLGFRKPVPVTQVEMAPMALPKSWDETTRRHWAGEVRELTRLQRELETVTAPVGLAWNDDLLVQRFMTVLRGRGLWNDFDAGPAGNPRAVHWLTFTGEQWEIFREEELLEMDRWLELLKKAERPVDQRMAQSLSRPLRRYLRGEPGETPDSQTRRRWVLRDVNTIVRRPLEWTDELLKGIALRDSTREQLAAQRESEEISTTERRQLTRLILEDAYPGIFRVHVAADPQPRVHLPHLCYLVFEPEVADRDTLVRVARLLLRPEESELVSRAVALWFDPHGTSTPDPRLKAILSPPLEHLGGARVIDLFALGSYLAGDPGSGTYPARPLQAEWLQQRKRELETWGLKVWESPAVTSDNRVYSNGNPGRRLYERGGVNVMLAKPRSAPSVGATNQPGSVKAGMDAWLQKVRPRVEVGFHREDSQPIGWVGRAGITDPDLLGALGVEVRFQYRLSASIQWEPVGPLADSPWLPSSFSLYHDAAPRRRVMDADIEMERQEVRWNKEVKVESGVRTHRWEYGLQLARVRDVEGEAQADGNEIGVPLSYGISAQPNAFDAREYWRVQVRATPTLRDGEGPDFWTTARVLGQYRKPLGVSWFYFGSVEGASVLGAAALDAFPFVGGSDGVRGVRAYGVPARTRVVLRQELWRQMPFIGRDMGSGQGYFGRIYDTALMAAFCDAAWADGIRMPEHVAPWFVSPGVGLRLVLGPAHLNLDYAYGIADPGELGGHRVTLGVTSRF